MSPKSILAGVLIAGFVLTVPFWLSTNTEDKQHLAQAPAQQIMKKHIGLLDIKPAEKAELRRLLAPVPKPKAVNFEQMVWVKDIIHTITPWVPDQTEAETIARWVYVYADHFKLSPELVLGVIAVESQFDHFAVSNVGAIGLMQVMPFWKNELGDSTDNLLKIETNVRYGCAILHHYIGRYKTQTRALAAYNGSLGRNKYPNKVFAKMKQFKATNTGS